MSNENRDTVFIEFKVDREVARSDYNDWAIYGVTPTDPFADLEYNRYGNVTIKGMLGTLLPNNVYKGNFEWIVDEKYGGAYEVVGVAYIDTPQSEDEIKAFLYEALTPMQADEVWREYPDIIDIVLENRIDEVDITKLYNIGNARIRSVEKKIRKSF